KVNSREKDVMILILVLNKDKVRVNEYVIFTFTHIIVTETEIYTPKLTIKRKYIKSIYEAEMSVYFGSTLFARLKVKIENKPETLLAYLSANWCLRRRSLRFKKNSDWLVMTVIICLR